MSLPSFKESAKACDDPWRTIVGIAGEYFDKDLFSNRVINGSYDGDSMVNMNAWSIVGFAPGYPDFLECHVTAGKEKDKPFWLAELREVIPFLYIPEGSTKNKIVFCGGMLFAKLGLKKHHVIGMVSLNQTVISHKSFAVVWTNPKIANLLAEEMIRYVLEERLN